MRVSPSLDIVYRLCGDVYIYGDVSTPIFRPLVPSDFRRPVFDALHGAAHPGRRATKRLVSSRFVWPKLAQQVTMWARECLHCQLAKTHRHSQPPPVAIPVPAQRFTHVNIDIVGPLPHSNGYSHLLTIVDRCSRWPEALPLSSTTAAACAAAFFHGWVSRFGLPSSLSSDRGPQFTSSVWLSLCSLLNISHTLTPAYHPQANGIVERFHRRLKDALRARTAGSDWYHHLPWVLLSVRTASRDDSSPSPAELLYGSQLTLPGQLIADADPLPATEFLETLRATVDGRSPAPTRHNRPSTASPAVQLHPDLLRARMVFIRRDESKPPLAAAYAGPYTVLERSPSFFRLQIGDKADIVATARLKPAFLPGDAQAADPPRRGRPPALTVAAEVADPAPASVAAPAPVPRPRQPGKKRVCFSIPLQPPSSRPARLRRPPIRLSL
jgi:transposase InsO family protein